MMTESPVYYHSSDPIENLKIKVTLRKIADGDNDCNVNQHKESKTAKVGAIWSKEFQWQQKTFGPREVWKYSSKKEGFMTMFSGHSEKRIETEYRRIIQKSLKDGVAILDENEACVVYSYTDKDEYVPLEELSKKVSSSNDDVLNDLARDVVYMPQRSTSKHGASGFLSREGNFKVMYLMACVEINSKLYQAKKPEFQEHVLCTIKYFPSKMMSVVPGFSLPESTQPDNESVIKGPRLHTYQFSSESGAIYEYAVENMSDFQDNDDILAREFGGMELQADRKDVRKWQNRCGWELLDLPPKAYDSRVLLNLEIVSASGFAADSLYIQYEVVLPSDDWIIDPDSRSLQCLRGATQTSKLRHRSLAKIGDCDSTRSTAHFGFPVELVFLTQKHSPARKPLYVNIQIFSRDRWERVFVQGYSTVELPSTSGFHELTVQTWKPVGSVTSQVQNFFIGGSNQLLDHQKIALSGLDSSFASKFGFKTETSGSIRLRVNIMELRRVSLEESNTKSRNTGKRGVNEILNSLNRRKSKKLDGSYSEQPINTDDADP